MKACTSHVLDVATGVPASGVAVALEQADGSSWTEVGAGATGDDGRVSLISSSQATRLGAHRLRFATGDYFARRQLRALYPEVTVTFIADEADVHLPLLLSPYGYSTYRGQ